eukprot:13789206-Alexandrium_andersonii.AAC.1
MKQLDASRQSRNETGAPARLRESKTGRARVSDLACTGMRSGPSGCVEVTCMCSPILVRPPGSEHF